ncbi:MAG: 1-deoxy-D-xylulose-5-phosphate reductoisomerase [Muribaculaceae bacterium]|nr:1-deoxy-D-xylulose-5-phosphate reductoisomerase [Muribaculaceae bacterium]
MVKAPKNIAVIGATGSIGTQTLEIIDSHPELYRVTVMAAGSKVDKLIELARHHRPSLAVIADVTKYNALRDALEPLGIETAAGEHALCDAVCRDDVDMVVTATVGYSGLAPTIAAIKSGKDIALANKETLVVAGKYITSLLEKSNSQIYPVDSEHSAIYQCLEGEKRENVKKLIITASGGPFRTWTADRIAKATASDALRHPNWSMGAKITIDSATMMNKAFEIIEAKWLFGFEADEIEAVVHPQSIVHSMVEFNDGAIKAQLGLPDMKLPIAYALGEGKRLKGAEKPLSITDFATLTFERPDAGRFPCLSLAHEALTRGGNSACVINAANEIAVAEFLAGNIGFNDIYKIIEKTLSEITFIENPDYQDFVTTNNEARVFASSLC